MSSKSCKNLSWMCQGIEALLKTYNQITFFALLTKKWILRKSMVQLPVKNVANMQRLMFCIANLKNVISFVLAYHWIEAILEFTNALEK